MLDPFLAALVQLQMAQASMDLDAKQRRIVEPLFNRLVQSIRIAAQREKVDLTQIPRLTLSMPRHPSYRAIQLAWILSVKRILRSVKRRERTLLYATRAEVRNQAYERRRDAVRITLAAQKLCQSIPMPSPPRPEQLNLFR